MEKSRAANQMNAIRQVALRSLILLFCFLFLTLLLSVAYAKELLKPGRESVWCNGCLMLVATISAYLAAHTVRQKKLLNGLLGIVPIGLFLFFLGVFTKEINPFNISLFYRLILLICCGFLGSFLGSGQNKQRRRTHKYYK